MAAYYDILPEKRKLLLSQNFYLVEKKYHIIESGNGCRYGCSLKRCRQFVSLRIVTWEVDVCADVTLLRLNDDEIGELKKNFQQFQKN